MGPRARWAPLNWPPSTRGADPLTGRAGWSRCARGTSPRGEVEPLRNRVVHPFPACPSIVGRRTTGRARGRTSSDPTTARHERHRVALAAAHCEHPERRARCGDRRMASWNGAGFVLDILVASTVHCWPRSATRAAPPARISTGCHRGDRPAGRRIAFEQRSRKTRMKVMAGPRRLKASRHPPSRARRASATGHDAEVGPPRRGPIRTKASLAPSKDAPPRQARPWCGRRRMPRRPAAAAAAATFGRTRVPRPHRCSRVRDASSATRAVSNRRARRHKVAPDLEDGRRKPAALPCGGSKMHPRHASPSARATVTRCKEAYGGAPRAAMKDVGG